MAQAVDDVQDDDYNSASDQDFNPNAPPPEDENGDSSSDDGNDERPTTNTKKRKETAEDLDFDNSGDEATISKARAKRKKQKTGSKVQDVEDEDEGGEGGLVKTRAQRKAEVQERKPLVQTGAASVNVEDLWAQMSAKPRPTNGAGSSPESGNLSTPKADDVSKSSLEPQAVKVNLAIPDPNGHPSPHPPSNNEATITIKRSYEFAGQKMEDERVVPASSAEARLYIEEQSRKTASSSNVGSQPSVRRPKKRASMFDNPDGVALAGQAAKGPKLNTLEKSKLDWATHVDEEGISEELDEHRRAKSGYLGRMDFLGRMDAKREEELKNVKPK